MESTQYSNIEIASIILRSSIILWYNRNLPNMGTLTGNLELENRDLNYFSVDWLTSAFQIPAGGGGNISTQSTGCAGLGGKTFSQNIKVDISRSYPVTASVVSGSTYQVRTTIPVRDNIENVTYDVDLIWRANLRNGNLVTDSSSVVSTGQVSYSYITGNRCQVFWRPTSTTYLRLNIRNAVLTDSSGNRVVIPAQNIKGNWAAPSYS